MSLKPKPQKKKMEQKFNPLTRKSWTTTTTTVEEIGFNNDFYALYHWIEPTEEYWTLVGENINTGRFLREDEYHTEEAAMKAWARVKTSVEKQECKRIVLLKRQLYKRRETLAKTRGKKARHELLVKIKGIRKEIEQLRVSIQEYPAEDIPKEKLN